MNTRERILAIRLMDKVSAHPVYAEVFGIAARNKRQTVSDPAVNKPSSTPEK